MAENRIRSANAPVTTAGVMIANAIWNSTKTLSGMVVCTGAAVPAPRMNGLSHASAMPFSSNREPSPIQPLPSPNASEYPATIHRMVPIAQMKNDCIMVPSTFFLRTMPA